MCRCTPEIRTPFCGKPGCEWPETKTAPVSAADQSEIERLQLELFELRAQVAAMRLELRKIAAEAERIWKEERQEKLRMAEVAMSYGCHRAGCIHEQQNDCNCGLWRELGML